MYFIGLGTVAVTTENGNEACHLEDGDHFGEFALIMHDRKRKANAMAVDYCEIYQLDRRHFEATIATVPELYKKLEELAKRRLDLLLIADERRQNDQIYLTVAAATATAAPIDDTTAADVDAKTETVVDTDTSA